MARTSRSAGVLAVASTLAATLVACSLLNGLDADYRPQSTSGEGGRDGDVDPDGNAIDARNDTDLPADGGVDSASDARFCDLNGDAANVVYCWDFEENTAGSPRFGWDDFESTSGSYAVEDNVGANNSRGLHAIVTKPALSGKAYLRKQIPGPFNGVVRHELSFAFSVKTKSSLYTASLGALGFGAPLKFMGVSVYKGNPDGIDVGDPPGGLAGTVETVLPGQWRRATIAMERAGAGTPYTTTISVTSASGTSTQVDQRTGFDGGVAPTEILVGAFFTSNDPDGGVETVIDDVLLKQTK